MSPMPLRSRDPNTPKRSSDGGTPVAIQVANNAAILRMMSDSPMAVVRLTETPMDEKSSRVVHEYQGGTMSECRPGAPYAEHASSIMQMCTSA